MLNDLVNNEAKQPKAERRFLSAEEYKTEFHEPPASLVNAATIALAEQLDEYAFKPHCGYYKYDPHNDLAKIKGRIKGHRAAAVQWSIRHCLERDWIVLEIRTQPVSPFHDPGTGLLVESQDREILVMWGKPGLNEFWRKNQRAADKQADTTKKRTRQPRNLDVLTELAKSIRLRNRQGSTQREAILDYTEGDLKRTLALERQLRRCR